MKKLQIAFLDHWLQQDYDALAFIVHHVPDYSKKAARNYVKTLTPDIKRLNTEIKHLKTLLKHLKD